MRTLRRIFEAIVAGVVAGIVGALGGLMIAGVISIAYYIVSVILSFKGNWIPTPSNLHDAIFGSIGFALQAAMICGLLGALFGFMEAFTRVIGRRSSHRGFLRR